MKCWEAGEKRSSRKYCKALKRVEFEFSWALTLSQLLNAIMAELMKKSSALFSSKCSPRHCKTSQSNSQRRSNLTEKPNYFSTQITIPTFLKKKRPRFYWRRLGIVCLAGSRLVEKSPRCFKICAFFVNKISGDFCWDKILRRFEKERKIVIIFNVVALYKFVDKKLIWIKKWKRCEIVGTKIHLLFHSH